MTWLFLILILLGFSVGMYAAATDNLTAAFGSGLLIGLVMALSSILAKP